MMHTATLDGISYRWSVAGEGQPFIFIGGTFQFIDKLGPIYNHLVSRYQLICIEMPGFGESDFLPRQHDFAFSARFIDHLVRILDLENVIIFGTSYGSPAVYHYARQNPHKVAAIILGGSAVSIDDLMNAKMQGLADLAEKAGRDVFAEAFIRVMFDADNEAIPKQRRILAMLHRTLMRLRDEDINKFITNARRCEGETLPEGKISTPALVFTGEYDNFTDVNRIDQFRNYCSDLQLAVLPQADHMFHLQQPELMLGLIDGFVAKLNLRKPAATSPVRQLEAV